MSFVDFKILLWSIAIMWTFASQSIVGDVVAKGSTCGPPTPPYGSSIIHPPKQENYNDGSVVLFGCKQGFYLVGPPIITCSRNTWTAIKFRCLGFCPGFRYIMNGQVIHVSPKVGKAAVEFHCNKNYRLIGRTRLECINGRWNGKLPFCEKLESCARLQAPANGTLLGNDTTHGAKVSFACLTGFDLFGSRTLTCSNGLWNASVPSCKAYCKKIKDPSNGRKFGTRFSHGNVVSFECKPGYKLVGNRALKCINGKWNSTVPVCNVMLCPKPSIPNNSYIIYPATKQDNYVHGTKLFLACRNGHYLTGSPIMECNQTVWLKMEFSCIASCPVLGPMRNGIITHVTLKDGGEVEIKCRTNYTLVGSPKLVCTNGKWNDSLPSCGAPCSEPATPSNGWKRYQDLKHGHSVRFYCSAGYDRLGASSITCTDGTWDNQVPLCKARCSDPGSPIHGRKRGEIFRHNSWVQLLCDANYQLDGDQWIQCVDGSWSGSVPKCIAVCPDPGVPAKGRRLDDDFRDGRTVRFQCNPNHDLLGNKTIKCIGGVWSGVPPDCKGRCTFNGNLDNGYTPKRILIKGASLAHGSNVEYACDVSYRLTGSNVLHCNDGKWNASVPYCKDCARPLGMENSNIRDFRITSPDSYRRHPSRYARLNGWSSWCTTSQTYLQIDLSRPYKVTAIATQGGTRLNKWVKRYTVGFFAGATLLVYNESGSQKVIKGNKDASSIVKYQFKEHFVTKIVRIYPDVDTLPVCLRTELYGCDPTPDCILVGSEVWGLWAKRRGNVKDYFKANIIKLNATHVDFALQVNNIQTRSYKRSDPVLVIDKIPQMRDIFVNSQVIAVHIPGRNEWYRAGTVTGTYGSSFVSVKFHNGQRRHGIRLNELRLVNRPRVCVDRV